MMSDIWIRRKVDVVNADVLNQSIKKGISRNYDVITDYFHFAL